MPGTGASSLGLGARIIQALAVRPQGLYSHSGSVTITRSLERPNVAAGDIAISLRPLVVRRDFERPARVIMGRLPMRPPTAPPPWAPRVVRRDFTRPGRVFRLPLLAPPVPGGAPPPRVVRRDYERRAIVWQGRPMPTVNPTRIAGRVPPPIRLIGPRADRRGLFVRPSPIPIEPASHLGTLILIRGGPSTSPNIPPAIAREPLYMTDSNQLFVGDGFNLHLIGGDFVSPPAHSSSAGVKGQEAWDGTYFYKCIGTNSWVRWGPFTSF